jgi:hypothetical protein
MDLKNFIASTLGEIQEAVQLAINQTSKSGIKGAINPDFTETARNSDLIQNINFDIAVTVADNETGGLNAGIKVVGLSIGAQDSVSSSSSKVSRIQFSIPVIPPTTKVRP